MVYMKIESETGAYQSIDGALFDILESTKVVGPQGVNIGWDTFNNIDEAAAAYGLTRVPEPAPEPEEVINKPEAPDIPPEIYEYVLKQIQEGKVKD